MEQKLLERRKSCFSDTEIMGDNEQESDESENNQAKPPLSAQTSRHQRVGSYRPMMVRGGYFVDQVPRAIANAIDYEDDNNGSDENSENDGESDVSNLETAIADAEKLNLLVAEYKNDSTYDSGPSHRSISQSPTQTVSVLIFAFFFSFVCSF